jgi:predicted peptidase
MFNKLSNLCMTTLAVVGAEAATLGAYNVDPSSVSASGLSAGGFMAVQLGVAYSNIFQTGFGVFAGGPYDCARAQSVSHRTISGVYFRTNSQNISTPHACTIKVRLSQLPPPT